MDKGPAFAKFLTFFVIVAQFFNLLRSYPAYQNCGRRVEIGNYLSTFINCDSSVFMKDAAIPSRMISGESVYQDRLLFVFLAILLSRLFSIIVPEQFIEVIGNSGDSFVYSTSNYMAFVSLNFLVLMLSIVLLYKLFQSRVSHSILGLLSFTTALFFIALNETTKTYIFTPHSQLFNILLPVWIIFIISRLSDKLTLERFYLALIATLFLSLNYKLFVIAYVPFFYFSKSFSSRMPMYSSLLAAFSTILLPRIFIESLGGNFRNYDISHQRVFIWWLDVLRGDSPSSWIFGTIQNFVLSIPIIPTSLLLLGIVLSITTFKIDGFRLAKRELIATFIVFSAFLMVLGFSARRLSFALISLPIIWVLLNLEYSRTKNTYLNWILGFLILLQLILWATTSGPLV
jgi:hypothetical protein